MITGLLYVVIQLAVLAIVYAVIKHYLLPALGAVHPIPMLVDVIFICMAVIILLRLAGIALI